MSSNPKYKKQNQFGANFSKSTMKEKLLFQIAEIYFYSTEKFRIYSVSKHINFDQLLYNFTDIQNDNSPQLLYIYILLSFFNCNMTQNIIWTEQQDQILKSVVQKNKMKKWSAISNILKEQFKIQGRSAKECQQRWNNFLDPANNVQQWTPQEQQKLFTLHNLFGNKWAKISLYIYGRSDNSIKNHFYSTLRKAFRGINRYISETKKRSEVKPFKNIVMGKIISLAQEALEKKSNNSEVSSQKYSEQIYADSVRLKNKLLVYGGKLQKEIQTIQETQELIKQIVSLSKRDKSKKIKRKRKIQAQNIDQVKIEENVYVPYPIIPKKEQKISFTRFQSQQQQQQKQPQVKNQVENLNQQHKPISLQTMPTFGGFSNLRETYYVMPNGNNMIPNNQMIYFYPWIPSHQYLDAIFQQNSINLNNYIIPVNNQTQRNS